MGTPDIMRIVAQLMERKGLSIGDLSSMTGIPKPTLQKYLNGERERISTENMAKIAEALHIPGDFILSRQRLQEELAEHGMNHVVNMIMEDLYRPAETAKSEITFDDFTYAMYQEGRELSTENKQRLLEMAKFFKQQQDQGKA